MATIRLCSKLEESLYLLSDRTVTGNVFRLCFHSFSFSHFNNFAVYVLPVVESLWRCMENHCFWLHLFLHPLIYSSWNIKSWISQEKC